MLDCKTSWNLGYFLCFLWYVVVRYVQVSARVTKTIPVWELIKFQGGFQMETITVIAAIKTFFGQDGGRAVTMDELKALSKTERDELGKLAAEALGKTLG